MTLQALFALLKLAGVDRLQWQRNCGATGHVLRDQIAGNNGYITAPSDGEFLADYFVEKTISTPDGMLGSRPVWNSMRFRYPTGVGDRGESAQELLVSAVVRIGGVPWNALPPALIAGCNKERILVDVSRERRDLLARKAVLGKT